MIVKIATLKILREMYTILCLAYALKYFMPKGMFVPKSFINIRIDGVISLDREILN